MTLIRKIFPKRVFGTPLDDLFIKLHTVVFFSLLREFFFYFSFFLYCWRIKA